MGVSRCDGVPCLATVPDGLSKLLTIPAQILQPSCTNPPHFDTILLRYCPYCSEGGGKAGGGSGGIRNGWRQ